MPTTGAGPTAKLRSWDVGRVSSAFLATLFHWRGDTGLFYSHGGLRKSRLTRSDQTE